MKKFAVVKRIVCGGMVAIMAFLAGCGGKDDSQISITVGNWPDKTNSAYTSFEAFKEEFEKLYPDVEIVPDYGDASFKTFMTRGVANQLPGIQSLPFTEINKVSESGFALELTEELEKRGYLNALNPQLRDMVTTEDGKIFCVPMSTYKLGLCVNKELFEQAGLVNEDGSVKYPKTYTELAEYAQIIREKTGKAGFIMQTMNNCGGWLFMPIAWSYGVDFVEKVGGKWKATFNSPEMIDALQYVYDLKWKYNALPDNALIDNEECKKLFAANEGAMYISMPLEQSLITKYSMDKDSICWAAVPEGPKGRYTLLGGSFWLFNANYSEKQVDALFNWLKIRGVTPEFNDDTVAAWDREFEAKVESGQVIAPYEMFELWEGDKERSIKRKETREKYMNVAAENFENYVTNTDALLRAEEPVACQELYAILDSGLQSVLTDKNVDIKALVKKMNDDFQNNSLNELEE